MIKKESLTLFLLKNLSDNGKIGHIKLISKLLKSLKVIKELL